MIHNCQMTGRVLYGHLNTCWFQNRILSAGYVGLGQIPVLRRSQVPLNKKPIVVSARILFYYFSAHTPLYLTWHREAVSQWTQDYPKALYEREREKNTQVSRYQKLRLSSYTILDSGNPCLIKKNPVSLGKNLDMTPRTKYLDAGINQSRAQRDTPTHIFGLYLSPFRTSIF
jgi:hypothetical protein